MPTQTYTPTAAWNNTSQYQQNGDVSDAAVAQLTGQDALDNLAYLTGANTLSQVRRLATVADLAALKALTTQRDQDYFTLDSNKRMYQYDAASAATADDYSVVQPTSGGGRYILQSSAVPETTAKRWVVPGPACSAPLVAATSLPAVNLSGAATANIANTDATGATMTVYATFNDFSPGDVISEVELVGSLINSTADITADFFLVSAVDGATAPAVTNIGSRSSPASAGAFTTSTAVGPYTVPAATGHYSVVAEIALTNTAGTSEDAKLSWVALNGTRSYIRE